MCVPIRSISQVETVEMRHKINIMIDTIRLRTPNVSGSSAWSIPNYDALTHLYPVKFNVALKIYHPKRKVVFQASFFRGYAAMLNFGGVQLFHTHTHSHTHISSHMSVYSNLSESRQICSNRMFTLLVWLVWNSHRAKHSAFPKSATVFSFSMFCSVKSSCQLTKFWIAL